MIRRAAWLLLACAGCPAPHGPSAPSIAAQTQEVGRDGLALHGVAYDGARGIAALTGGGKTMLVPLGLELDGAAGPIAAARDRVVVALGGTSKVAGVEVRGEPGAVLATVQGGAVAAAIAVGATEWVVVTSLAMTPDGVIAAGSFAGTLRIGDKVVTSAGKADGFVVRIAAGAPAWLVRVGGPGADTVQGVAFEKDRVALAGTFSAGADVLGQPLPASDERSPYADAFVAELDAHGARLWVQTFGGASDDAVAGVAIDERGHVAVAGTARETVHAGGADLVAQGPADGLVAWFQPDGSAGSAVLIGGGDFDGLRAITAVGDHVVVGGFYSGTLQLGDRTLSAAGGDDAFLAELDDTGRVVASWQVTGEGREEITALAEVRGGFIAGVAHTAGARIDDAEVPAPHDPMAGAAIVIRSAR